MARTISCKNCGEVIFNIAPNSKDIECICDKCNTIITLENDKKYETYNRYCKSCKGEYFKVKISEEETINIECVNCGQSPDTYYLDKDNKKIDRSTREILLLKDDMDEIKNEFEQLKDSVKDLQQYRYREITPDIEISLDKDTAKLEKRKLIDFSSEMNNLKKIYKKSDNDNKDKKHK